jgi:hypothetical protein
MGADEAGHFWSSSDPTVAQDYTALDLARDGLPNVQPHITPAEMRFQRPLVVDAQGRPWSEIPGASGGTYSTDALAQLGKDAGYDGLVVRNVRDMKAARAPVATTYTALQPGTVFSPTMYGPGATEPAGEDLLHHSNYQPRDGGTFKPGVPRYPKGDPRREK